MSGTPETNGAASVAALARIVDLLAACDRLGILLYLSEDRQGLRFSAPRGVFTPEMRETARTYRDAILAALVATHGDMEGASSLLRSTYHDLMREELAAWGKANRYPRLTYAWWANTDAAPVPRAWIPAGLQQWRGFLRGGGTPRLIAAYEAAIGDKPDADKGAPNE